jgi:5-methylthioribose kinase
MVAAGDTRVIDPEFAFYGPIGFDLGVLLANFLMSYMSQAGHASRIGERDDYRSYLLDQVASLWSSFTCEFSRLWHEGAVRAACNLYNQRLSVDSPSFLSQALAVRLQKIWNDALGFAGCEMIRRIVGLAHIADFESIEDPDRRAACERLTIIFARRLLLERPHFSCVSQLTASAAALPC